MEYLANIARARRRELFRARLTVAGLVAFGALLGSLTTWAIMSL